MNPRYANDTSDGDDEGQDRYDTGETEDVDDGLARKSPNEENVATDKEQAMLDRVVHNAMLLMHEDKKTAENIAKRFKEGAEDDPVGTLASLGLLIGQRLWDSSKGAIDLGIFLHAAPQIMDLLVEVSDKVGAHEYTQDEKDAALQQASVKFQANNPDAMPPDQAKSEWANLQQQDQDGEIDRQFPDSRQHYEGVIKGSEAQATQRPSFPPPGNRKARRALAAETRRQRSTPQGTEA